MLVLGMQDGSVVVADGRANCIMGIFRKIANSGIVDIVMRYNTVAIVTSTNIISISRL